MHLQHLGRRLTWGVCAVAMAIGAPIASADTLSLTASKNPVPLGEQFTITFTPKLVSTNDQVTFNFGDGQEKTVTYNTYCGLFGGCGTVEHTYTKIGEFTVEASGEIGGKAVEGTLQMIVSAGKDLFVLAAAHATGNKQTVWRSDVEIHNYGIGKAVCEIALLERDKDNSTPQLRQIEINPTTTLRLADVLATEFTFSGAAALRITPKIGTIIATSRTYNLSSAGTFGQFVPAMRFEEAISTGEIARLIQLSHEPSLASGFRTNLGLVNPTPVSIDIEISFYDSAGVTLGTTSVTLQPLEFKQLDKVFELVTNTAVEDGYIRVRTTTIDAIFFAYASVVDNLTGDPTLVPAIVP